MRASARQGPLPFWIHQVVEYGIAAVVASSGARLPQPALPIVAAVVIVALAATADGPVAAVHLVKRGAHRVADWVVGIGLIVAGGVLFRRVGSSAALLTGLAGIALLALSWRTNYAPKPPKAIRQRSATWGTLAGVGRRASNAAQVVGRQRPAARESAPVPARPQPDSSEATRVAASAGANQPSLPPAAAPGCLPPPVVAPAERTEPTPPSAPNVLTPPTATATAPAPTPPTPPTAAPLSRGARAEEVGRKAGRYAAVGVKVWRNRKN